MEAEYFDSYIDTTFYNHFRFEKYTDSDGRPRYAIAGYITVFQVRNTLCDTSWITYVTHEQKYLSL